MGIPRYSLKQILLTVAAISGCLCLVTAAIHRLSEPDVERVTSKTDCWSRLQQLIEDLERQNIEFENCEMYRAGWQYFLSCPADDRQFTWLQGNLGLKELDSHDHQVAKLYRLASETPLSLPTLNSTRFYQGITGYTSDDTIHDHFFVVAYDKAKGRLLVWYYNLY